LEVDPDGKRISLSLRRAQRAQRLQQLEPGTVLDGTVSGISPFGAFVDIGVGRDGLVHISELSGDRVGSVEDVVKVGDKVQVKVLDVDQNSKRISLTMRVDEPPPAERPQPVRTGREYEGAGEGGAERISRSSVSGDRGRGGRESTETVERQIDYSKFERRPAQGTGGRGRPSRPRRDAPRDEPAQYTSQDPVEEETFTGDATLEDLVSKFNAGKGRRTGGRRDERDETEGETEDGGRNRRSVINRTLAMRDDE
jgi:predicted RNA-binding protein with RPS1 domain